MPTPYETSILALTAFREEGKAVCPFLEKLLCNDLYGTVTLATPDELAALLDIILWAGTNLPSTSWGSLDQVRAWHVSGWKHRQEDLARAKRLARPVHTVNPTKQ